MNKEFVKRILSIITMLPLCLFLIIKGSYFFNIFLIICLFITIFEWTKMNKFNFFYFLSSILIFFSFYSAYLLRNTFSYDYNFFLLVLFICIFSDVGGYIFGKIFKGPKLTRFSPNKTFSGVFGSYFLSLLCGYIIFVYFLNLYEKTNELNYMSILTFIFLISSVSQIGDIIISFFKRKSKIKDTGNLIPGHGGILDRIDGMIFAFPFSYLILNLNIIEIFK